MQFVDHFKLIHAVALSLFVVDKHSTLTGRKLAWESLLPLTAHGLAIPAYIVPEIALPAYIAHGLAVPVYIVPELPIPAYIVLELAVQRLNLGSLYHQVE